jgi:hypothetical protein
MSLRATKIQVIMAGEESVTTWNSNVPARAPFSVDESYEFTDGTGALAAQKIGASANGATVNAAGTTFDLQALTSIYPSGTVNFTKVKGLYLENLEDAATPGPNLIVGAAAADAWEAWTTVAGSTLVVPAGTAIIIPIATAAGWTVDATHKNLKLAAASATVSFRLAVLGEGT